MTPEEFHRLRNTAAIPSGRIFHVEAGEGPAELFFPEERPDIFCSLVRDHWRAAERRTI